MKLIQGLPQVIKLLLNSGEDYKWPSAGERARVLYNALFLLACLMASAVTTCFCWFLFCGIYPPWHPRHFQKSLVCSSTGSPGVCGDFQNLLQALLQLITLYAFLHDCFISILSRETRDLLLCFTDSSEGRKTSSFSYLFFSYSHYSTTRVQLPVSLERSRTKSLFSRTSSSLASLTLLCPGLETPQKISF